MLLIFVISIFVSFFNIKLKNYNSIFAIILFFHLLTFFFIHKQPAPRIFTGFYAMYILIFFNLSQKYFKPFNKFLSNNIFTFILFLILSIKIINFNYLKIVMNSIHARDLTFNQDIKSRTLLNKKCILKNNNFSELQKRNYYFNYLNLCSENFNLNEFLDYYRS